MRASIVLEAAGLALALILAVAPTASARTQPKSTAPKAHVPQKYEPSKVKDRRSQLVFRPSDKRLFKTFYPLLRDNRGHVYRTRKLPKAPAPKVPEAGRH